MGFPPTLQFRLRLTSAQVQRIAQITAGAAYLPSLRRCAAARGLAEGDEVQITNQFGVVVTPLKTNPGLIPGVAALPKGLWARHTRNGATANALAPDTLTDLGGGACFNDARVQVSRAGAG